MHRNSKEFKDLQKTWYSKLEKKGFQDIEQDETKLKSWSKALYDSRHESYRFSNEEYYRLAGHFLHDYKFETKLDKFVWEQHSLGLTSRDIAKLTKAKLAKEYRKSHVHNIIKKLEKEMLKNVK